MEKNEDFLSLKLLHEGMVLLKALTNGSYHFNEDFMVSKMVLAKSY